MKEQPPSSFRGGQALGLAWTLPVLLLVYIGLGYWLGGLLGSKVAGVLVGWAGGMFGMFYEIRRVLKSARPSKSPAKEDAP